MNQEIIESFVSVINYRTTSAAAKAMFVSQSTISHRIQVLEQELNLTLFTRERGFKQMELTEAGKTFYPLALQWLELNSRMLQIKSTDNLGKIKIGSMDSINQYILPPIINDIRDSMPKLQMEFVSYHSQEIYLRLNSMQLDVGFAFYPVYYNDIKAIPVFREPMLMICLPGSRYPSGTLDQASLKKEDQILFPWNDNILRWNDEWWSQQDPPYVKVDSCALVSAFLTKPDLWAVCPASVATSFRAAYNVEIHTLLNPPPDRICYMLMRRRLHERSSNEGLDIFVDAFNIRLAKHPWRYT